jgi:hypothetical protein
MKADVHLPVVATACFSLLLSSCATNSNRPESTPKFNRFAPVSFLYDRFPRPIKGTFNVSTMPLSHTDFIEEPRQRQAESVIIMCLERAGLQHTDSTVGTDWRVLCDYRSDAELLGMGYRHEMHMNIRRPGTVDNVWTATARIHSNNPDIGPVIPMLTSMLTRKFPDVEYRAGSQSAR